MLSNEEISLRFGVGSMGGMRRSKQRNLLVLISDPFKGLYQDRWEAEVLHYTGMGPTGDQDLNYAQNRTLAESGAIGISVHLVEALEPQKYTYAGEVELVAPPYQETQLDDTGQARKVWMYPLRLKSGIIPTLSSDQARGIEESHARFARRLSTAELKKRAQRAKKYPPLRATQASAFVRDASVAEFAKRLAHGICDLCENAAPFKNKNNEAYLECHHVIWLAKGGQDSISNTVALRPNCHRKMHVVNLSTDQARLRKRASERAMN